MLFIMLAAAYPFGRPEDEQLKPSKKMHVMLQVGKERYCFIVARLLCMMLFQVNVEAVYTAQALTIDWQCIVFARRPSKV